jgi:hypothetical protein
MTSPKTVDYTVDCSLSFTASGTDEIELNDILAAAHRIADEIEIVPGVIEFTLGDKYEFMRDQ